jgi:hypothetical protein
VDDFSWHQEPFQVSKILEAIDEQLMMASHMQSVAAADNRWIDKDWYRSGVFHLQVVRDKVSQLEGFGNETDFVTRIVDAIEEDLNDRIGLHIDSLDEDTRDEIRKSWSNRIREVMSR